MDNQHINYTRELFANQEEALSKIFTKVKEGSVVLDIGCGSGMLGKFLALHKQCVVDGIDIDSDAVLLARPKYRRVEVFNLELTKLSDTFQAAAYDCIVMADVVEHLVNPEQLFQGIKQLLKPDGILLFSIPNITHIAAGLELVLGHFGYRSNGLLDSTHVRFYSRQSFLNKLEAYGIYPEEIDTIKREFNFTEFAAYQYFPQTWIRDIVQHREDALTYQWIITAKLFRPKITKFVETAAFDLNLSQISLTSRLYWQSINDQEYSEDRSAAGKAFTDGAGITKISFEFSQEVCRHPIAHLRIDPVSDTNPFIFFSAEIVSLQGEVIWSDQQIGTSNLGNARSFIIPHGQGQLILPQTNDPQWFPAFNETVLRQIVPGCALHLTLMLSASCIMDSVIRTATTTYQQKLVLDNQLEIQAHQLEIQATQNVNVQAVLQSRLTALQSDISARAMQMDELQQLLNLRTSEALHLSHVHTQTLNTLSWKITKPLRWIRAKFK